METASPTHTHTYSVCIVSLTVCICILVVAMSLGGCVSFVRAVVPFLSCEQSPLADPLFGL